MTSRRALPAVLGLAGVLALAPLCLAPATALDGAAEPDGTTATSDTGLEATESETDATHEPVQGPGTEAGATEPLGPALDPDDEGVDAERLVVVPAVEVSEDQVEDQVAAALAGTGETATVTITPVPDGEVPLVEIDASSPEAAEVVAAALAESPLYEALDYGFTPVPLYHSSPNDPAFQKAQQWALGGFPGAGFDGVWTDLGSAKSASSAPVADIDSGFLMSHADACSNIIGKYDYGDGDSDVNPTSMGSDADTYHGTATAGVIGACTDNGWAVSGAAWDQHVYVYKISSSYVGAMTDAAMINAIRGATDDGARVINLSVGFVGTAMPSTLKDAIDYAISKGVIVVASAGNYGSATVNNVTNPLVFPAAYDPVISVAATDINAKQASFSTYNSQVDIAAPGASIIVLNAGGYGIEDGTSFAAPHVAAAVGLLLRFNPDLQQAEVKQLLRQSAHDVGPAGRDIYTGYGVLDVVKLLKLAKEIPASTTADTIDYTMEQIVLSPDMDGDGRGEVIAVTWEGDLRSYPVNADGTLGSYRTLGQSFGSVFIYAPGDWNGDGRADLLARDAQGVLFLFPGDGSGYLYPSTQIGHGWSPFRIIPAGDLTSDGRNDLLAIDDSGRLWLYAGNGSGGFKTPYPEVGRGWRGLNLYAAGDLNSDGRKDILMLNSVGGLYAYMGRGNGTFGVGRSVGHGWVGNTLATGADLDGDGRADIVGRDKLGNLYFYKGKGAGTFYAPKRVGLNW
ncbi:MAG: S8 family serine peptidase [Bifidobacteriaceae bacterium]|jgi:hypothetical protein|nr:S8 family serine peptidase [Bifidobacteriaceae bacterium]